MRPAFLRYLLGALLGAAFVYASLDKIWRPAEFARIVYHYQVIGPSPSLTPMVPNLFAVAIPWVELVAGLCLILGIWRREAAVVVAVLLVLFLVAVGHALYFGIDVANCGCFTVSAEGRQLGASLLITDIVMLAVAIYLAVSGQGLRRAFDSVESR